MFKLLKKRIEKKEIISVEITQDMTIGRIIREFPKAVNALMGFGMGCIGCPSAQGETLGEAAAVHGIDVNKLLNALNAAV